jgi:hypothetical protein
MDQMVNAKLARMKAANAPKNKRYGNWMVLLEVGLGRHLVGSRKISVVRVGVYLGTDGADR